MTEKQKLSVLINKPKSPTVKEWVYEVEAFLISINELNDEAKDLIRHIKINENSFGRCDNLVALLRQLKKRK